MIICLPIGIGINDRGAPYVRGEFGTPTDSPADMQTPPPTTPVTPTLSDDVMACAAAADIAEDELLMLLGGAFDDTPTPIINNNVPWEVRDVLAGLVSKVCEAEETTPPTVSFILSNGDTGDFVQRMVSEMHSVADRAAAIQLAKFKPVLDAVQAKVDNSKQMLADVLHRFNNYLAAN